MAENINLIKQENGTGSCDKDMEMRLIQDLLKRYKEAYLSVPLDHNGADELYKWQLITECEGKSELDIIQKFKTKNIVDVARVNQVLTTLSKDQPQQLANNFSLLTNEDVPLSDRLSDFKSAMGELCGDKFNVKANDERTASAFLACWNPNKYTFYKDEIYQNYCNYINAPAQKAGNKYPHYLQLLESLVQTIRQDAELTDKFATETDGLVQSDLLIAQNILWQMKDMITNDVKHYWLYAPGDNATFWDDFYDLGIMAIGWDEIGDLSKYGKKADIKNKMIEVYGAKNGSKAYMNYVQCTWDFVYGMSIGDVVFVKQGLSKILGYGIVTSDYYFDDDREEFCNVRTVNWKQKGVWAHPGQAVQKTLTNITQYTDYVEKLKLLFMNTDIIQFKNILSFKKNIILQGAPGTGKTYNTAALALAICGEHIPEGHGEVMLRYEELQKEGRIGFVTFHQSMDYEDFVEGIKPKTENGTVSYEVEDGIFKLISNKAQTKQGSDILDCIDKYIHSIEGYANKKLIPTITGRSSLYVWWNKGNSTLSTRSSISSSSKDPEYSPSPINIEKLKMQAVGEGMENNWPTYAQAIINAVKNEYRNELEDSDSTTPYVLIIDEINRGNVSKIFGELITLLEADKRIGGNHPIRVTLPYSKESFGVPSNLYIIGTMNTTDRSVGNIDYAVRRRFAFATLKADKELVKQNSISLAIELFEAVESFIKKHQIDMDFEDLMVGHSYFFAKDEYELELKWQYEILPLLNEYIKDGIVNAKPIDNKITLDMFVEMCLSNSLILKEDPTIIDFEVQTKEEEVLKSLFHPSDEIHGVTYYMQFTEIMQVLIDYTHNNHLKPYNLQVAMKKYGFLSKSIKQRRFEMQPRNLYPVKITQNNKWLYDRCYEFMDYHQLKANK